MDPDAFVARVGEEIYDILGERPDFEADAPFEEIVLGEDETYDVDDATGGDVRATASTALDPTPPW